MPRSSYLAGASRAAAAIAGGYAFAAAAAALLAQCLPLPRADAVVTATLLSFALYAAAALRAFAAPSAWRAWLELLAPAVAMALAARGLA
jgi:hypothetical protein